MQQSIFPTAATYSSSTETGRHLGVCCSHRRCAAAAGRYGGSPRAAAAAPATGATSLTGREVVGADCTASGSIPASTCELKPGARAASFYMTVWQGMFEATEERIANSRKPGVLCKSQRAQTRPDDSDGRSGVLSELESTPKYTKSSLFTPQFGLQASVTSSTARAGSSLRRLHLGPFQVEVLPIDITIPGCFGSPC